MRTLRWSVVLLLLAGSLQAATISTVSPMKLWLHEGESWLTIDGSGFSAQCLVTFSGPAGTFTLAPNSSSATRLIVWVPLEVTNLAGKYTVTACDSNGVQVEVIDMSGPTLYLPLTPILAEGTSKAGAVVEYEVRAYAATDGHPVPVQCNPPSGSTFSFGTSTVQCMATDDVTGGMSSGSFKITVTDRTPPVLQAPEDMLLEADRPDGSRVVDYTVTASDNIDGPLTPWCDTPSGSVFQSGITQVACVAIDAHMNATYGKFNVTIVPPNRGPVLDLPDDITTSEHVVTYTATATDDVDGAVPVTCNPPSGSTFPTGTTTVRCSASDTDGNTATGSFDVTVTEADTTPPVLDLPDDVTTREHVVTYTATATDDADGAVPVTCNPPSGSSFPSGTTTVQCSATDTAGNTATGSFSVTVIDAPADTEPPVLTLPDDLTAEATSSDGAIVTYAASAHDGVDGDVLVTCSPASGDRFPLGTTLVTCSAADAAHNDASGTFSIRVADSTPPAITHLSATPSVLWPANHKRVEVRVTAGAIDAVDDDPQSSIVTVVANEPIDGPGDGSTESDWEITGPLTVALRAERSGASMDRVYTIFVDAVDASGNRTTGSVKVTVPHEEPRSGDTVPPATTKRRSARH